MRLLSYSLLAIALLLGGCVTTEHTMKAPETSLDGEWKSATSKATVRFEKGKISGNDGCNQFVGSYATQGNSLSVSDKMMSTMMACPDMERSTAFKNALTSAKIYDNNATALILMGAKGETLLELQHLSSVPDEGLYTIGYINNGKQAVVSVGHPITMHLSADGKIQGDAGCNHYTASYTIKEDQITIGAPATTRKMCAPEVMEQEQQFLNALQKSSIISRNGEKWEVRDSTGALQFSILHE